MAELKPCPFCGGQPKLFCSGLTATTGGFKNEPRISVDWTVKCQRCFTKKEDVSLYSFEFDETIDIKRDGKRNVIELWNRRAEDGN